MLGAIIGDICGSIYEFNSVKSNDFEILSTESFFTDDTVLTIAIAEAVMMDSSEKIGNKYVDRLKFYTKKYPNMDYGLRFLDWIDDPKPYNSYGNGSAMRVSSIGFYYNNMSQILRKAQESAEITHNHPEGIKGAQAVALAIFMARNDYSKEEIKTEIEIKFHYNLSRTLKEIESNYDFYETCQDSVPEAIIAFLESDDFITAIRNAIWLKGDADTQACIAGSIAEAYYKEIPYPLLEKIFDILPNDFQDIIYRFYSKINKKIYSNKIYGRNKIAEIPLSNQTIEKMLEFLPYFSLNNYSAKISPRCPPYSNLGYVADYSEEVGEFVSIAIRERFSLLVHHNIFDVRKILFDKESKKIITLIKHCDLTSLRMLLSNILRREKWIDLLLLSMIKDKVIKELLKRLKYLYKIKKATLNIYQAYKPITRIISKEFCFYYDKYDFNKYSSSDYEEFKNDFSSLLNTNKSIEKALKWKWGHANKINYPKSHKIIIKKIENNWETFIKLKQYQNPKKTFNYWQNVLKGHTVFITIAFITHLVHNDKVPIIDQHNYRAMNYFMLKIECKKNTKKKPTSWNDLLIFKRFLYTISTQMHLDKEYLDKYLMMKGKQLKKSET